MPAGKNKSRSFRIIHRRTPGSSNVIHYAKRKPKLGTCYRCGDMLKGIKRERQYIMKKLPKSSKRPGRAFGGVLCSKCMRREIIVRAR